MRLIIILFLTCFNILHANEPYIISSKELNFENDKLLLNQDFKIDGAFGNIQSKKATIENLTKGNFKFYLEEDVNLRLQSNGILKSDFAFYDSQRSTLTFFSKDNISFTDQIPRKNSKLLKITSKKVKCKLDANINLKKTIFNDISSISFLEDVRVTYSEKFNCLCEKAILNKGKMSSKILLYPKKNTLCKFFFEENEIYATHAQLNFKEKDIFLENAKGTLYANDKKKTPLLFTAKNLIWRNFENSLCLKGDVFIDHKGLGFLRSEEIELIKRLDDSSIHKIITKNNTNIQFLDKNKQISSQLTSKGTLELDNEKRLISAFSSKKTFEDHILFQDDTVTISAKKATLAYSEENSLSKIALENNVKFIYQKQSEAVGYGIADKVNYNPNTKIIELISDMDNKVLFWQDDNQIKLSANEIHIDQSIKNSIVGVGDVRFTFNIDEEQLFNEIFSQYINNYE